MTQQRVIQLFGLAPAGKEKSIKGFIRTIGSSRTARVFVQPAAEVQADPYILLLLADQELADGREDQARSLIEAAYDYFDGNNTPPLLRPHGIG